jgi:hypothetical protein
MTLMVLAVLLSVLQLYDLLALVRVAVVIPALVLVPDQSYMYFCCAKTLFRERLRSSTLHPPPSTLDALRSMLYAPHFTFQL